MHRVGKHVDILGIHVQEEGDLRGQGAELMHRGPGGAQVVAEHEGMALRRRPVKFVSGCRRLARRRLVFRRVCVVIGQSARVLLEAFELGRVSLLLNSLVEDWPSDLPRR